MEEKSIIEENMIEAYKEPVPYIVYQGTMARFERIIRKLALVIIIAVAMIFASNMAWLYAWNMYDYESSSVVVDSESKSNANYIGASGIINNGESDSEKDGAAKEER